MNKGFIGAEINEVDKRCWLPAISAAALTRMCMGVWGCMTRRPILKSGLPFPTLCVYRETKISCLYSVASYEYTALSVNRTKGRCQADLIAQFSPRLAVNYDR